MTFWERQQYQDGEQITACQGLGEGQGVPTKGYTGVCGLILYPKGGGEPIDLDRNALKFIKLYIPPNLIL